MMLRFRALALLILFSVSTIGNAIDVHYCEGQFTDIALFGDVDCCCVKVEAVHSDCETKAEDKCHSVPIQDSEENSVTKKGCCDTATIEMIRDKDFAMTKSLNIPAAIIYVHFNTFIFQELTTDVVEDFYFQPPYRIKDIPLFNQVFII